MANEKQDGRRTAAVIGGAGFLGRRLVGLLAGEHAEGHPDWPRYDEIIVIDRATYVEPEETKAARARTGVSIRACVADVREASALAVALEGADTVYHLASLVDVGLARNPEIDRVNIEGARNVVKACHEVGARVLVYTSSEDVALGPTPVAGGDESMPYPSVIIHDYVRTKIEGEKVILAANGDRGLATCSIRPVHLYGPHDPHAIEVSIRELASGRVPFVLGDGSARFDVVYVDNVAHAHLLAAKRLEDDRTRASVAGQAFFIGEDNALNYFEWLRPYAESKGVKIPARRLPFGLLAIVARGMELVHRVFGVDVPFHSFHLYVLAQDFWFSNEKAKRLLGYRPIVTPEEGQRRTLAWLEGVAIA